MGLGNPGPRYAGTRHNAGQLVIDELARRLGVGRFTDRYAGRFVQTRGPAGPVALLVPTTYMNDSGRSVGPAAGALRLNRSSVLVIHDEIDLPFGGLRAKVGGGHGGHNGLRSIIQALGGRDFLRVRVGVGRPPTDFRGDEAAWVLGRFTEPAEEVRALLTRAADMVESVLEVGIDATIARFHASPPGERARRRAQRRARAVEPEPGPIDGSQAEPE
ncbi:MAG TPA: aminoacyl-tRNA hydrolase [Miltoncostaeaceae bacterium]|nr:aminoacyl-tRNA hydrolase [Miltoncostaeaceae bacterium]